MTADKDTTTTTDSIDTGTMGLLGMDTSNSKKTLFAFATLGMAAFAFGLAVSCWAFAAVDFMAGGNIFFLVVLSFLGLSAPVLMYFFAFRPSSFLLALLLGFFACMSATFLGSAALFTGEMPPAGKATCAFLFINWILLSVVTIFTFLWRQDLVGEDQNKESMYEQHQNSGAPSSYSYEQGAQDPYSTLSDSNSNTVRPSAPGAGAGGSPYASALQGSTSPYAEKESQNI